MGWLGHDPPWCGRVPPEQTWSRSFANGLPLVPVIASILVSQSVSHLVTVSQSVSQDRLEVVGW